MPPISRFPEKLLPGYAETSTRRNPKEPDIVIVTESDCKNAVCLGAFLHPDGRGGWLRFKIRGKRRYYFQHRPY